jgi:hypothetical protein
MTEKITPFASVVTDLSWIPVLTNEGIHTRVGLRDALSRAHEFTSFDTDSPVELSTLNRFLSAVAALVVREMGGKVPSGRLDSAAVDAVLDRHASMLFLRHPDTPFAQEWQHDPATGSKQSSPIAALRFESPGASSKEWKVRGILTARWMPKMDLGVIALHLLCHWFHSVGGNAQSLHSGVRALNGSIGSRVGNDLALFWRGRTLADTILANTPKEWVLGQGLPAFLDRTGTTRGSIEALHPLWAMTYAPNAVLLKWDGDEAPGYRSGGSQWGLNGRRTADEGAASKPDSKALLEARKQLLFALKREDPARIWHTEAKADGTVTPVLYTKLSADQAPLVRLREWYSANGSRALTKSNRVLRSVMPPNLAEEGWAMEFYTAKIEPGTSTKIVEVAWLACDPGELDFDDPRAELILAVAGDANSLAMKARTALTAKDGPLGHSNDMVKKSMRGDLEARFYTLAEDACRLVISNVKRGRDPDQELRNTLATCAITAFEEATERFMSGANVATVIRLRQSFRTKARGLVRPAISTTPTTPTDTEREAK